MFKPARIRPTASQYCRTSSAQNLRKKHLGNLMWLQTYRRWQKILKVIFKRLILSVFFLYVHFIFSNLVC